MGYRASISTGVVGAVIVAVSLTPSLAGQAPATSPSQAKAQEEARKLIRDVADSLRAKDASKNPPAPPQKNWKPSRTPWGDPDIWAYEQR